MTSTETNTAIREHPDHPTAPIPRRRRWPRLELSMTQLVATALAAITATIVASYFGVSGTVIGAALASVVSAVGNAVYGHSLRSTRDRVRVVVPSRRPSDPDRDFLPQGRSAALPTANRPENVIDEAVPTLPATRPRAGRRERNPWRGLAIGAISVFVAVLAVVTGIEVVAGRPLADIVRGDAGSGTSVFGTAGTSGGSGGGAVPTVTKTVIPSVVITTPTVTQTAPAVTQTAPPTTAPSTSAPGTGTSGTPSSVPTAP
jgi:hypothetical protein